MQRRNNTQPSNRQTTILAWLTAMLTTCGWLPAGAQTNPPIPPATYTLDECLHQARENNHRRPASQSAIAIAEAQHQQALAGYWPQFTLRTALERRDQDPNYIFPSRAIDLPMGGTIPMTIPGVGTIPLHSLQIPAQEIKLADRDSAYASAQATWLIYDGGLRSGLRQQTSAGLASAHAEARRTDLEIADTVHRHYYGAVLARLLHQLGRDTLARLETTLQLTETLFKEGSGEKVKKTDYLENKLMVENLRTLLIHLEKNETLSQAALANTLGLSWRASIRPADTNITYTPFAAELEPTISTAYQFNPDWARLEAGLAAAEGAVQTARSGHAPKLAFTGDLHQWWNEADTGTATRENKQGWTLGLGLQIPLGDGYLTRNKVREARARADQLKQQKILLQEGLGLQIKDLVLGLVAARQTCQATATALQTATENRDLNTRAYQNELVETERVIRAQLVEALTAAQHYRSRYEHQILQSQLNLVVGTEITQRLGVRPE